MENNLMKRPLMFFLACGVLLTAACAKNPSTEAPPASPSTINKSAAIPEWKSGYRIFVTNETTGDLSILDGATHEVLGTVPLGKRPRGIHASPDGKTIYVALSGSPIAPPG